MTSDEKILQKSRLIAYLAIVVLAFFLYVSRAPWQQCINTILGYYEEISLVFTIAVCCLIPLRILAVAQKGMVPETRKREKFRMFGPLVVFIFDPLYDTALFYSALFMLHAIFQRELSLILEPLLVLLLVSGFLLYESVTNILKLAREIFYVQRTKKVVTG